MTTAKDQIPIYLAWSEEEKSTAEIANALDYSSRHVRKTCKDLRDEGLIQGSKTQNGGAPAVTIQGDYVVLTSYRPKLISLVEAYAEDRFEEPEEVPTEDLIRFLRDHVADDVKGVISTWSWWA